MKIISMCALFFVLLVSNILTAENEVSVNIFYCDDHYFVVKGYYYYFDKEQLPFSINQTDTYILSNEQIHTRGNSSFVTMRLTSLENQQSYDFESLPAAHGKLKIVDVTETNRTIIPGTGQETYRCHFDERCTRFFPIWDVKVEYDLQLEDGSFNKLAICKRERSEEEANRSVEEIEVLAEDEIELGIETGDDIENYAYGEKFPYRDTTKIFRGGELLHCGEIILKGAKKTKKLFYAYSASPTLFTIKGYFFPYDPTQIDFKIDRYGSYFALVSEEVEKLPYDDYRVTIGLVYPKTQEILYFTTPLSNDEPCCLIDHFVERDRSVELFQSNLPPNLPIEFNPWCVKYELEVFLENGLAYTVEIFMKKGSKQDALKALKEDECPLQQGDSLILRFDPWMHDLIKDVFHVFYPRIAIQREGQEIPYTQIARVDAKGPLRSMKYPGLRK